MLEIRPRTTSFRSGWQSIFMNISNKESVLISSLTILRVSYLIWIGVMKCTIFLDNSNKRISNWWKKISRGINFLIETPQAIKAYDYIIKLIQHCWKISWSWLNNVGDAVFTLILRSYDDRWINTYAKAVFFLMSVWDKYFENILQSYSTCEVNTAKDFVYS